LPRKDIYKDAKGFDVNKQNINRKGAPKKTISVINLELENQGYTEATDKDVQSCYLRLINVSMSDLKLLIEEKTAPALVRIVGKNILGGKGFDIIEKMLDRANGKAKQQTDITTNGKDLIQPQNLTIAEREAIIAEIIKNGTK